MVLTCEHAGKEVPPEFQCVFLDAKYEHHRWYDLGARDYAQALADSYGWVLFCGDWTRLLVDLNRSENHRNLFSAVTRKLPEEERRRVIQKHYRPFRARVKQIVLRAIKKGQRVVHLSCHTFTPRLRGIVRSMDVGVLYDPRRLGERNLASILCEQLRAVGFSVRKNAPYKGVADGHVTALRRLFTDDVYLGLEIEVNQRMCARNFRKISDFIDAFSSLAAKESVLCQ